MGRLHHVVLAFGLGMTCDQTPVPAEGDEARGLLALIATPNLLHRTLQVVVSEQPENSAKIVERMLVGLKKRLLRRGGGRPPLPAGRGLRFPKLERAADATSVSSW